MGILQYSSINTGGERIEHVNKARSDCNNMYNANENYSVRS